MCTVCGCGAGEVKIEDGAHEHSHVHEDGTVHTHAHDHGDEHNHAHSHDDAPLGVHSHSHHHSDGSEHSHAHVHEGEHVHEHGHEHHHEHAVGGDLDYGTGPARAHVPGMSQARMVQIEQDILSKNNAYAHANRAWFDERGIFALNLVSSPGSGKTTLLCKTIELLKDKVAIAVVEGDPDPLTWRGIAGCVINPAIGIGTFLAQLVLSKQINEAATRTFHVTGTWADPAVTRVATPRGTTAEPPAAPAPSLAPLASPAASAAH